MMRQLLVVECIFFNLAIIQSAPSGGSCQQCEAYGQRYAPNSDFQYANGCQQFNCECHCDGSWECPGERVKDICQDGCDNCLVDGRERAGNQSFTFTEDSFQYDCFCQCDGSWDICNTTLTTMCVGEECGNTNQCRDCVVDDQIYTVNTTFERDLFGTNIHCQCQCNGDYKCIH